MVLRSRGQKASLSAIYWLQYSHFQTATHLVFGRLWAKLQPILLIHFIQSVTSMRQKKITHVFSGNRKLGEVHACPRHRRLYFSSPLYPVNCSSFFLSSQVEGYQMLKPYIYHWQGASLQSGPHIQTPLKNPLFFTALKCNIHCYSSHA